MAGSTDKPLLIGHANYLGGLIDSPKKKTGNFAINDTHLGMSILGNKFSTGIALSDIKGVSFDSETVGKSRTGKALAFGVLALAAKSTKSVGQLIVHLNDGQIAAFEFEKLNGLEAKAKIMGRLSKYSIPCLDDVALTGGSHDSSVVDQLRGAQDLLASGALSQDEFDALKAKILAS